MKGFGKVRVGAAVVAAGAILSCAGTAQAQRPADLGAGAPSGQMGVQLYDWSKYISATARARSPARRRRRRPTPNCVAPPAPSTSATRLERVFEYLQSKNVKNVELYGYPGNPFPGTNPATPLNAAGLQALRALGDSYGLRFVSPPRQPRRGQLGPGDRRPPRSSARKSSAPPTRPTPATLTYAEHAQRRSC